MEHLGNIQGTFSDHHCLWMANCVDAKNNGLFFGETHVVVMPLGVDGTAAHVAFEKNK
jgi:hypothetical protein